MLVRLTEPPWKILPRTAGLGKNLVEQAADGTRQEPVQVDAIGRSNHLCRDEVEAATWALAFENSPLAIAASNRPQDQPPRAIRLDPSRDDHIARNANSAPRCLDRYRERRAARISG